MAHALPALLIALAVAASGAAQTPADLSGSWTLEQGSGSALVAPLPATLADGPPPPPPPPRQVAVKITQTLTAFQIARTLGTENGSMLQEYDYKLDGSATTSQMGPIVSRTTAVWNGHELVLWTVHSAGSETGPMAGQLLGNLQETFTLQDGRLVIQSVRNLHGNHSTETLVYTRAR